ncbi:MAG: PaaI family thioesterase [Deltaproteobacteria bacterium]|nr:PaaI family thioesterase [Deltaproteobacteria bacterium]
MELPENVTEMVNAHIMGFDATMGMRYLKVSADELIAELTVGEQHHQPYGLVHGGVHAGLIEAVCSTGAAVNVMPEGKSAVGLDNMTSFLRASRSGTLRCRATPIHKGRRSHVWQAEVRDGEDRLLATGRVRLMILDAGAAAAGETVELQGG